MIIMNHLHSSWHSSYEKNNYGDLFCALMQVYQPEKVVELGTRAGYSAYHIARGLATNGHGTLDCYDLWERNVEHYGREYLSQSATEKNLKEFRHIITLELRDALGVEAKYEMVDIVHIDLDNDAEILEKIVPPWVDKTRQLILIEGGSRERDEAAQATSHKKLPMAQWLDDLDGTQSEFLKKKMGDRDHAEQFVIVEGKKEYVEKPIAPWFADFSRRRGDIEYFTLEPFPSLTIMRKRP